MDEWRFLRDDQLLERKISSLGLGLKRRGISKLIHKLYGELASHQLGFRPPCFVADEWFCPVGVPAIGVPFFLTHPRLVQLEKRMVLEVEGQSSDWFMKLIRHEAGHAYTYAFKLQAKSSWREIFGPSSIEYPDTYRPRPYSRSYVLHLENWYAQSHPDEDFAETFAVWLTPGLNWRERYKGWAALRKLEYVDRLMSRLVNKEPLIKPQMRVSEYAGLDLKLKTYYRRKRKLYEDSYPEFYDADLKRLFGDSVNGTKFKASKYLAERQSQILDVVSFWTREKKFTINLLMKDLIDRSNTLKLKVNTSQKDLDFKVSAYVTSLVTNHLFTGKFKRPK